MRNEGRWWRDRGLPGSEPSLRIPNSALRIPVGVAVQRTWIHHVLPLVFALLPAAAGLLVLVAIPPTARADYLTRLQDSHIDWVILALGGALFVTQTVLAWKAMKLLDSAPGFDERPDKWLAQLSQAAEWFPLLGLIGTVAAILQTFSSFSPDKPPTYSEIIQKYGPAITATGSGLFMALLNILPVWMVGMGRDLIKNLSATDSPAVGAAVAAAIQRVPPLPPVPAVPPAPPVFPAEPEPLDLEKAPTASIGRKPGGRA